MASVTVAQISEFSFVLMAMGLALNHVSQKEVALVILVGVITMTISTYLILGADRIFKRLKNFLSMFERKNSIEVQSSRFNDYKNHIVLIGAGRTGSTIISFIKKNKIPYVVIEQNPKIVTKLTANNISTIFGDISDPDILEEAKLQSAFMVISTVPNFNDNKMLLELINKGKKFPLRIIKANSKEEGIKLYEAGATYVVIPEILGGEYIKHLLKHYSGQAAKLASMGKHHFTRLLAYKH